MVFPQGNRDSNKITVRLEGNGPKFKNSATGTNSPGHSRTLLSCWTQTPPATPAHPTHQQTKEATAQGGSSEVPMMPCVPVPRLQVLGRDIRVMSLGNTPVSSLLEPPGNKGLDFGAFCVGAETHKCLTLVYRAGRPK